MPFFWSGWGWGGCRGFLCRGRWRGSGWVLNGTELVVYHVVVIHLEPYSVCDT